MTDSFLLLDSAIFHLPGADRPAPKPYKSHVLTILCKHNRTVMAKDIFHDNVREALIKEGWTITAEQLRVRLGRAAIEIDMMAENIMVVERDGEKIAVEVKSF
jgi:hypothetical protein